MKKKVQKIKKGKEVDYVNENIESSDKDNHNTTDDIGSDEEKTEERKIKKK